MGVGFVVGGLLVVAVIEGASVFTLSASLLAMAASVAAPLVGLVVLAVVAPLLPPLVIPPPGLFVAISAAMLFGIILRLPVERPRLRLPPLEVLLLGAFLAYVGIHVLGGRLDGYFGARSSEIASAFARLTEAVVAFGVAYVVLRGRSPFPVLAALLLSAAVASFLALTQVIGVDQAVASLLEPPGESGRISGVFADPNMYGSYLAAMITVAVACAAYARSTLVRTTLLSLVTLYSVSLVFTQSRGAMVAAMVGLAVVAFSRGRRMGFAVLAGFALIGAVAYPLLSEWRFGVANEGIASLADAGGRVGAWQAGLDMFVASPLFGIGFGQFVERAPLGIAAHNWYVQVLAELGLAGFVLWALFIVATMVTLRGASHWARTVGYSALAVWMAASLTLAPPFVFGMSGSVLIAIAAACAAAWPLVRAPR